MTRKTFFEDAALALMLAIMAGCAIWIILTNIDQLNQMGWI